MAFSSSPSCVPSDTTARRASPTCEASVTGMARVCSGGSAPANRNDTRALPCGGGNVELIDEPSRAAQPEPHAAARGEAVPQRLRDIRNPRSLILERQAHAAPLSILERLEHRGAAAPVNDRVARELARGRDHLRL